jgi:DNA polymerase-3 subunit epsilon
VDFAQSVAAREAVSVTIGTVLADIPTPIAAVDLETTGLDISRARLVQIAIVHANSQRVERAAWSAVVSEHLSGAVEGFLPRATPDLTVASFDDLAEEVLQRLDGRLLVAHGAAFDVHILARELAAAGARWRPAEVVCTRVLARLAKPDLASYRLIDLVEAYGLPLPTHDALDDARSALALYRALTARPAREAGQA